jgi:hypothetical protein
MNESIIMNTLRNEAIKILSTEHEDVFAMELLVFQTEMDKFIRPEDGYMYANIINKDPLLRWFMHNIAYVASIQNYIMFNPYDILADIQLYEPYLSKWITAIIIEYSIEFEHLSESDGISLDEFISNIPLPYYIKNDYDSQDLNDTDVILKVMFRSVYEALSRNDYKFYIDMCLEAQRCLMISMLDHKEII